MSALALEAPYVPFTPLADRSESVSAHPRGRGFGVLSRIARVQIPESDYIPRHRLDEPELAGIIA